MDYLRRTAVTAIGGLAVSAVSDYQARTRRIVKDGVAQPLILPASNVLAFELEGGSRIIARPSGTEPKVKYYFDWREVVREGEPLPEAEARGTAAMAKLAEAFVALATPP